MLPGVQESVREWTFTLLSELPLWELESRWTLESSESNFRGQNLLDWKVLYIIGKFLELICLNGLVWPIWTLKTQVITKRRVGNQIDNLISNHKKSGITLISLRSGCVQHIVGKLSIRNTTFLHTSFQSEVSTQSYGPPNL